MPDVPVLRLGGVSSYVDLEDKTKYLGFRFIGPPVPNRDKTIRAAGCGSVGTTTAVVIRDRVLYWTRTYEIACTGTSHFDAETNALAIETQTEAARNKEYPAWLIRHLYDQPAPTVWTMLTGLVTPLDEELYGISPWPEDPGQPLYIVRVELDVTRGWAYLDGDGYPVEAP